MASLHCLFGSSCNGEIEIVVGLCDTLIETVLSNMLNYIIMSLVHGKLC
jgi:hypothetical protein